MTQVKMVKLQVRNAKNWSREGYHKVHQIQIPASMARELKWKKGFKLILATNDTIRTLTVWHNKTRIGRR